ncbi:MAG: hypothetical protein ABSD74_11530 [Rhizomicrobium sp.]|jgi:hypothetical protein
MKRTPGLGLLASVCAFSPAFAGHVPVLSGNYVYTADQACYGQGGTWEFNQTTAIANFNPSTGTATLNGYQSSGAPPTLSPLSDSSSYSNTATTITVNGTTFEAFYGKASKKVASYVSFIGINGGQGATCEYHAWMWPQ